jgi:hypothetical protein
MSVLLLFIYFDANCSISVTLFGCRMCVIPLHTSITALTWVPVYTDLAIPRYLLEVLELKLVCILFWYVNNQHYIIMMVINIRVPTSRFCSIYLYNSCLCNSTRSHEVVRVCSSDCHALVTHFMYCWISTIPQSSYTLTVSVETLTSSMCFSITNPDEIYKSSQ